MREQEKHFRQLVRRPEGAAVSDEVVAHFAALSESERELVPLWSTVEKAFTGGLTPEATAGGTVAAAVVVPLVRLGEEASVILTRRSSTLRSNPGDVAFPGGRLEEGETALEAAVREAFEEVGLDPSRLRLLDSFAPVTRATRTGRVAVFVAAVEGNPVLVPNPKEVDACLLTPLRELADPTSYWEERWQGPDGTSWQMPFFDRGDDVIWGATARILVTLLDRLAAFTRLAAGG